MFSPISAKKNCIIFVPDAKNTASASFTKMMIILKYLKSMKKQLVAVRELAYFST